MLDDASPSPYATSSPVAALPNAPAIALRLAQTVCRRFPGASADPASVRSVQGPPPFAGARDAAWFATCVDRDGVPIIVVRIKPWQIETGTLASPPPVIDASP